MLLLLKNSFPLRKHLQKRKSKFYCSRSCQGVAMIFQTIQFILGLELNFYSNKNMYVDFKNFRAVVDKILQARRGVLHYYRTCAITQTRSPWFCKLHLHAITSVSLLLRKQVLTTLDPSIFFIFRTVLSSLLNFDVLICTTIHHFYR
jgi:hypothetical protein